MDEVSDKLLKIFQIVIDWVKYAEAKNAVLLGFCGAGITAIITYLSTASKILNSLSIALPISLLNLCFCALFCAISFLPRINLEHLIWLRGKPSISRKRVSSNLDNLYYYGHLLKYKDEELLEAFNQLYFVNKINKPYNKEYLDLANQIIINSEIAFLKFKMFTFSLWFLIASILIIPIIVLSYLVIFRHL